MKLTKLLSLLALTIITVLFTVTSVMAGPPNKVRDFYILYRANNLVLSWTGDFTGEKTSGYKLYTAYKTDSMDSFRLIERFDIEYLTGSDSLGIGGADNYTTDLGASWDRNGSFSGKSSGNRLDTMSTNFKYDGFAGDGNYYFYLTSFNDSGESDISEIRLVTIKKDTSSAYHGISIRTNPNTFDYIYVEYVYNVNAVDYYGRPIYYYTFNAEPGMAIDSISGKFTFTPTTVGMHHAGIVACIKLHDTLNNKDSIFGVSQEWNIQVYGTPCYGAITGQVIGSDGNPVDYGMVNVFKKDSVGNDSVWVYSARISFGNYYIPLDTGTYYLMFSGDKYFATKWYSDSYYFQDATPVTVKCGDTTYPAKTEVKLYQQPSYYDVTGSVVDAADYKPIPYLAVEFIGTNDNGGSEIFISSTNSNGLYSISLSDAYTYIARAVAYDSSFSTNYIPQFYKDVEDPTLATVITLGKNMDSINFHLKTRPNYNNEVSGFVTSDSVSSGIYQAYVIAYLIQSTIDTIESLYPVRTELTDNSGNFKFTNLLPGEYVLMVVPPMREYVPGYYKLNSLAVINWLDATRLTVTETSGQSKLLITLKDRFKLNGVIHVKGSIGEKGKTLKSNDTPLGNDKPVVGAGIIVTDLFGRVVDYTFTDNTGNYVMKELTKGKYTLYADRIKYDMYSIAFEIKDETVLDIPVTLQQTPTSVDNPELKNSISVYPNPATDNIIVNFNETIGNSILKLYNSNGIIVCTNNIQDGATNFKIESKNLSSGVYWIYLNNNGKINSIPVVIIK